MLLEATMNEGIEEFLILQSRRGRFNQTTRVKHVFPFFGERNPSYATLRYPGTNSVVFYTSTDIRLVANTTDRGGNIVIE